MSDTQYIFIAIALVLLIISYRKFSNENYPLSSKAKAFIIGMTLLIVIPILIFSLFGFYSAYNPDYKYDKAQSAVTYHVYQPAMNKDGRTISTTYITGRTLANKNNAVSVFYDIPFEETFKGKKPSIIAISQVGVDDGFDFDAFVSTFVKDADSLEPIQIQMNAANKAYLVKKNDSLVKNSLVILTSENVLITLLSPKALPEELVRLAETMK